MRLYVLRKYNFRKYEFFEMVPTEQYTINILKVIITYLHFVANYDAKYSKNIVTVSSFLSSQLWFAIKYEYTQGP